MKPLKFVALILLATIFFLLDDKTVPPSDGENCGVSRANASQPSSPISNWQDYYDPDFKIAFQYPMEWDVKTTIEQNSPYTDSSAILKRLTLIGKEGLIDLDIWSLNGLDFVDWLDWYGQTRSPLPVMTSNAKAAGNNALAFLENGETVDLLTVFWGDENNVYRLWYTVTQNKTGLDVYYHILDSIILPGKEVASSEVPDDIKHSALNAVEESGLVGPLLSSCCGYNSPGNPFPCCSNKGNCTWWVFYKYGYVPFRGDAGTWWSQVPNYPDWTRAGGPKKNQENIAWWSGSPGHVAYAANYAGGSNITISEMLWCKSCGRTRTIATTLPNGYIYEKYPPQP